MSGGGDQPAALRLTGIRKSFGPTSVLRGVDLDVAAGERVAILGTNGAGKSTLLRVAATLTRPDAGTIHVAGMDARKKPEAARARLSVTTQDAPVYAELTPHEHLAWWARVQGIATADGRPAERPAAIEAATVAAGLAAAAHKPAGTLSRGQRQRLALAMAFLPARPLLLLDEPFAALDAAGSTWLEQELTAHRERGGALLLALHDEAQARRLADRALHLAHGRLAS